jgi:hypothetical protein
MRPLRIIIREVKVMDNRSNFDNLDNSQNRDLRNTQDNKDLRNTRTTGICATTKTEICAMPTTMI